MTFLSNAGQGLGRRYGRAGLAASLLAALLSFILPPGYGLPLVEAFAAGGRRIAVYRHLIALTDRAGGCCIARPPAPYEIKDAAADTRGSYLFAILGLRGAPRGQRLAAYSLSDPVRLAWLDRDRGYNPWKITSGDVDGDGGVEVCVIVWKKTRFHPVLDNRPFIFAWDGTQLYPKWLGSRLSSPFVDLALGDLDGDGADELIALEWRRDGRKRVMSYKWSGFGFEAFKILRDDVRWRALPDGRFPRSGSTL